MNTVSQFQTLRDYVDAQPRSKRQDEIARELGVSPSAFSGYLNRSRIPSRAVALKLSHATGVPVTHLLHLEGGGDHGLDTTDSGATAQPESSAKEQRC